MIVHNPVDVPVRDYPIQDKATKEVNLWTILPGETLEFPDSVGQVLVDTYGFLQEVITQEEVDRREAEAAAKAVGQQFSKVKIASKPTPTPVPPVPTAPGFTNELMRNNAPTPQQRAQAPVAPIAANENPAPNPAMVGGVVGDSTDQPSNSVPTPSATPAHTGPVAAVCPDCGTEFQNASALKTHYAHKHLVLPGVE